MYLPWIANLIPSLNINLDPHSKNPLYQCCAFFFILATNTTPPSRLLRSVSPYCPEGTYRHCAGIKWGGEIITIKCIKHRSMAEQVEGIDHREKLPAQRATTTSQLPIRGGNQDFIRHLALMEAFWTGRWWQRKWIPFDWCVQICMQFT